MHSYLRLYSKRDDFLRQFATQAQASRKQLVKKGLTPVNAKKRIKHNAWKWVKKYI